MNKFVIVALLAALIVAASGGSVRLKREMTFAELADIDETKYLENRRAVEFQIKCVVYDGPCDSLGKLIKKHAKAGFMKDCDAVEEAADFCTPENMARLDRVMKHLEENFPEAYADGKKKYLGE